MGSIQSLSNTVYGNSILNATFRVRGRCYLLTYGDRPTTNSNQSPTAPTTTPTPSTPSNTLFTMMCSCPTSRVLNLTPRSLDTHTHTTGLTFEEEELVNPIIRIVEVKRWYNADSPNVSGISLDVRIEIVRPDRIDGPLCTVCQGLFTFTLINGELNSEVPAGLHSRLERIA